MRRLMRAVCLLVPAVALLWLAASALRGNSPEVVAATSQPLEYGSLLQDLLEQIAAGRIEEAVALFEQNAGAVNELARESLRTQFSTLHAAGGACDGIEIVAVQPISPRLHRVLALMHFERSPIVFAAQVRQFRGRWVLGQFQYSENVMQFLDAAPVRFLSVSAGEIAAGR